MKFNLAAVAAISGLSVVAMSGCASTGHSASMSSVPMSVRDAATKAAGGNKIEKFETENEDGKTVYEASFETGGVDHTITLDAAGAVIEEEAEVKVADLPAAVTATVLKTQPLAHVKEAVMVRRGEQSFYEIDAKVGEDKHELAVATDGKLMTDKVEADEEKDHDGEHGHEGNHDGHGDGNDGEHGEHGGQDKD